MGVEGEGVFCWLKRDIEDIGRRKLRNSCLEAIAPQSTSLPSWENMSTAVHKRQK